MKDTECPKAQKFTAFFEQFEKYIFSVNQLINLLCAFATQWETFGFDGIFQLIVTQYLCSVLLLLLIAPGPTSVEFSGEIAAGGVLGLKTRGHCHARLGDNGLATAFEGHRCSHCNGTLLNSLHMYYHT